MKIVLLLVSLMGCSGLTAPREVAEPRTDGPPPADEDCWTVMVPTLVVTPVGPPLEGLADTTTVWVVRERCTF